MVTYSPGIDIRVRVASRKAIVTQDLVHFFISSMRSLLEAIEGFLEVVDKTGATLKKSGCCSM
jgi:hypothetical protein